MPHTCPCTVPCKWSQNGWEMQLHALLFSVFHALTQVQDSAKAIVEFAHSHLWTYMVGHLILLQNS